MESVFGGLRQCCDKVGNGATVRRMVRLRLRFFRWRGDLSFYGRARVGRRLKTKADDSFLSWSFRRKAACRAASDGAEPKLFFVFLRVADASGKACGQAHMMLYFCQKEHTHQGACASEETL